MTALPQDVVTDLEHAIAELEQRLESGLTERDEAIARLQAELRAVRDRQAGSAEILRAIAGTSGDAERSLHQIAETTARLFGASSVTLRIASGGEWSRTINVGPSAKRIGLEVSAAQLRIGARNLPGTVVLENRQIHIPDINNVDPAIADWPGLPPARAAGTRVMAGTPLRREGKAIGALIVHRDRPEPFTAEELALLQSFADQAVIAIENARLFNETQEALARQTATSEILRVINNAGGNLAPVFDCILENAHRLCGAPCGSLQLYEHDRVVPVAIRGMTAHFAEFLRAGYPITEGIREGLVADHPVQRVDTAEFLRSHPDEPSLRAAVELGGIGTMVTVPLAKDGVAFGRIVAARQEVYPFTDKQIALLQGFADQAVIAIENARLFNETQEALARQTATSDILRVISQSPTDVQPVFDAIVLTAARLLRCDRAFIQRCDGATFWTVASSGQEGPLADLTARQGADRPGRQLPVARDRREKTLHLPDWSAIDLPDHERRIHETLGINSALFMPLLRGAECIGLLAMAGKQAGMFGETEIALAESFRDQALIAIENTRLFNETQEALERQTATAEILKVIASSPSDVQPVFDVIVEHAVRLCGGRMGRVYRYDGGVIQMVAGHGLSAPGLGKVQQVFPRPATDDTIAGQVMLSHRPWFVTDIQHDDSVPPLSRQMIEALGTRSQVTVPMLRAGEAIGAITVGWADPGAFGDQQVSLLQTFADQAVIAIENVRLFNETKEALERQTATADILKVIASSPADVQPVFEAIAESARRLLGGHSALVTRVVGDMIHLAAFTTGSEAGSKALQSSFPVATLGPEFTEGCAFRARCQFRTDIETEADVCRPSRTWRAPGAIAACSSSRCCGRASRSARSASRGATPDRSATIISIFCRTFADQAVIAIENVRLFNETKEALERQTATADILKVIASSPSDVQPVFEAIATSSNRLIGGFSTAVLRFIGDELHLAAFTPTNATADEALKVAFPRPLAEFPPFMLVRDGETVQFADTESEDVPPLIRELARLRGYRSMLFTPLMNGETPIGLISVTRKEPGTFAAHHVAVGSDLRRPGRDRHRERAPVRRGAGENPRPHGGADVPDRQQQYPQRDRFLADRCRAGSQSHRRKRLRALRGL